MIAITNQRRWIRGICSAAVLLWIGINPAIALEKNDLKRGLRAVVRLLILDDNFDVSGICSGTLLDNLGHILTNYHCVGQTDLYGEEPGLEHGDLYSKHGMLAVAINNDPRKVPELKYLAQYVSGNPDRDLAILRIVEDLDGNPAPARLPLVTAKLGDSDKTGIADDIYVLGFPSVGGETVTFTSGTVSGFLLDEDGTVLAVKTDAMVNAGNSGGSAINDKGELIGVPSAGVNNEDIMFLLVPTNLASPLFKEVMVRTASTAEPVDTQQGKVIFAGTVYDIDTNRPLEDVTILLLNPGTTVQAFLDAPRSQWSRMIASEGSSNYRGSFFVNPPLLRGDTYSLIVVREGYSPLFIDDAVSLGPEDPDFVEQKITMQRE